MNDKYTHSVSTSPLIGEQVSKPRQHRTELRKQRLQELMESCQREVLQQIIGPFGLTPAMFDDKNGGNVTTTNNFEQGVTATAEDQASYEKWKRKTTEGIDRSQIDADLKIKRKDLFKNDDPIVSAYTGKELPRDGKTHLDHVVSVNEYERSSSANLFQSTERRKEILNSRENLVPTESSINQSMGDRDKKEWNSAQRKKDLGKTNGESFGVDTERLDQTYQTAQQHIKTEQMKDQLRKQGGELLSTGAAEAGKQALRQAMGILLHTFTNQSFIEVRRLIQSPQAKENFIDELEASLKRIAQRVTEKLRHALEAIVSGGVEGFISNLLTFLINNFITTAAKVVTIIRESIHSFWQAIKLIVSPPPDMSAIDIARQVSKIIAGTLTMALGLMLEESVKAFILSVPLLVPVAEVVAPALTAIVTGLLSALVVYGIDRLFDALMSKGTELLETMEVQTEAQVGAVMQLHQLLNVQVAQSRLYSVATQEYAHMATSLRDTNLRYKSAAAAAESTTAHRQSTINMMKDQIQAEKHLQSSLDSLLSKYGKKDTK